MAQLVSSKSLLHSTRPLVVGVLPGRAAWDAFLAESGQAEFRPECDLLELRLDQLGLPAADVLERVPGLPLPCLVTARHPEEGGEGGLDADARRALVTPFFGRAAFWDVELRSLPDFGGAIRAAQAAGTAVIGSFHDFDFTPGESVLEGAAELAEAAGLDLVKVATFVKEPADLERLIRFAARPRRVRVSVMGMGAFGRVSRLVLAKCGSLLNYGYLGGSANAPGQWPAGRLRELLAEL
jgi:3-dehydroquinate dehydratase-1